MPPHKIFTIPPETPCISQIARCNKTPQDGVRHNTCRREQIMKRFCAHLLPLPLVTSCLLPPPLVTFSLLPHPLVTSSLLPPPLITSSLLPPPLVTSSLLPPPLITSCLLPPPLITSCFLPPPLVTSCFLLPNYLLSLVSLKDLKIRPILSPSVTSNEVLLTREVLSPPPNLLLEDHPRLLLSYIFAWSPCGRDLQPQLEDARLVIAWGPIKNGYTTSHEIPFVKSDLRDSLGDLDIDELIILEIILQK